LLIGKATKDVLNRLSLKIIQEPQEESSANLWVTGGFMQRAFPDRFRDAAGGEALSLAGDEVRLYREALGRLGAESELEHISERDVDDELWDFVCGLFVDRTKYKGDPARAKAVRELVERLRRPWRDYDVMAVIENVRLTVRELDAAGVKIRYLSPHGALEWGLGRSKQLDPYAREFVNKVVAIAQERAGSPQRAAERAANKIDDALHALRTAVLGSSRWRVLDEHLLFKRGQVLCVREVANGEVKTIQWRRAFEPVGFEFRRHTAEPVRRYLESINAIIDGDFPEPIQRQLRRALHWIGSSITRESHDDKVVELCTALETLLTTREEQKKGEALALRSMLLPSALGEGFFQPFEIYDLYKLRSEVIHGSKLRVCGQRDYSSLLWRSTVIVSHFADFVIRDRSITSAARLIAAIERPELLSQAIVWLGGVECAASTKIVEFARERLQRTA
jgi:hypothetical protein